LRHFGRAVAILRATALWSTGVGTAPALAEQSDSLSQLRPPFALDAATNDELHDVLGTYKRVLEHDLVVGHLELVRETVFALAIVGAAIGFALLLWREVRNSRLVIEPFDVPPEFEGLGWSGRVAARRLHDKLTFIHEHSATIFEKQRLARAGVDVGDRISIPGVHFSLSTVFSYIRSILGRDTIVEGEFTREGDRLTVTVRTRGRGAASFRGEMSGIDKLLLQAADHVMLGVQPPIAAVFRRNSGDIAGAGEALKGCMMSPNKKLVSWALNIHGLMLRAAGDRDSAAVRFEAAQHATPKEYWGYENLIALRIDQGRHSDAEEIAQSFYQRTGRGFVGPRRRSQGLALLGQVKYLLFEWDAAKILLNKALRYDGRNQRARALMPFLLLMRHDYAEALALAESNLSMLPELLNEFIATAFLSSLAACHIAQRDFVTARDYVDQSLERYPAYHSGWARLGMLCLATHHYDEAISHLRKAIDMAGVYAMADTSLVQALVRTGQTDDAFAYIERSLLANPKNPPLLAAWGDILIKRGDADGAIEKYQKALNLLPTLAEAYDGWARALALSHDLPAAISRFERAVVYAPNWSAPHLHWGDMLAEQGDAAGAIAKFKKAIDLDPKWAEPYARWGAVLERSCDRKGAQEKYKVAITLDPINPALISLQASLAVCNS